MTGGVYRTGGCGKVFFGGMWRMVGLTERVFKRAVGANYFFFLSRASARREVRSFDLSRSG
jgi:hypothetical protein